MRSMQQNIQTTLSVQYALSNTFRFKFVSSSVTIIHTHTPLLIKEKNHINVLSVLNPLERVRA